MVWAASQSRVAALTSMPRSEGNITMPRRRRPSLVSRRLPPAELSVAGDGAQCALRAPAAIGNAKVGHATFGDDMGDVVAVDHHRRQREARRRSEVERVQLFDKARCAIRLTGLHHLHHELASAQALARFLARAQPGRTVVAAAAWVRAHVRRAAEAGDPVPCGVELLPCASICNVPPMKRSQAYCPATCASARLERRLPSAPTGNMSAWFET